MKNFFKFVGGALCSAMGGAITCGFFGAVLGGGSMPHAMVGGIVGASAGAVSAVFSFTESFMLGEHDTDNRPSGVSMTIGSVYGCVASGLMYVSPVTGQALSRFDHAAYTVLPTAFGIALGSAVGKGIGRGMNTSTKISHTPSKCTV